MNFISKLTLLCLFLGTLSLSAATEPKQVIVSLADLIEKYFRGADNRSMASKLVAYRMERPHPLETNEEAIGYFHFLFGKLYEYKMNPRPFLNEALSLYRKLKPSYEQFREGLQAATGGNAFRDGIEKTIALKVGRDFLPSHLNILEHAANAKEIVQWRTEIAKDPIFGLFKKSIQEALDKKIGQMVEWNVDAATMVALYGRSIKSEQLEQIKNPTLFLALFKAALSHHAWDSPEKLSAFLDRTLTDFYANAPSRAQVGEMALLLTNRPVPLHRERALAENRALPALPALPAEIKLEPPKAPKPVEKSSVKEAKLILEAAHFFDEDRLPDFDSALEKLLPAREAYREDLGGKPVQRYLAQVIVDVAESLPNTGYRTRWTNQGIALKWLRQMEDKFPGAETHQAITEAIAHFDPYADGNPLQILYRTTHYRDNEIDANARATFAKYAIEFMYGGLADYQKEEREVLDDFFSKFGNALPRFFPKAKTRGEFLAEFLTTSRPDPRENRNLHEWVAELLILEPSPSSRADLVAFSGLSQKALAPILAVSDLITNYELALTKGLRPARGEGKVVTLQTLATPITRKGLDDFMHEALSKAAIPDAAMFHRLFEMTETAREVHFPGLKEPEFIAAELSAAIRRHDIASGDAAEWVLAALRAYPDPDIQTKLQETLLSIPTDLKGGSREAEFERVGFYPDRSLGRQSAKNIFITHLIEFINTAEKGFSDQDLAKTIFALTKTARTSFYQGKLNDLDFIFDLIHDIKNNSKLSPKRRAVSTLTRLIENGAVARQERSRGLAIFKARPLSSLFPSNRRLQRAMTGGPDPITPCKALGQVSENAQ